MRTNVTSMDIRRRLRSLFGSGSGAAKDPTTAGRIPTAARVTSGENGSAFRPSARSAVRGASAVRAATAAKGLRRVWRNIG